ncbi:MAG: response regulator [Polyangiaceae bacterium]
MKRLKTLGYSEGGLVNQVGETRIMVVDDDPSYRRALARTLSEAGYDVSTAPDRRTALWMCDRLRPHLVLTDLELLDGGTGLDLAAAIKRTLGEAAPPVIVVTASAALPKATDEVRQVLPKMDNETLLEAISQCLAARE